jgi:hypothetical protein
MDAQLWLACLTASMMVLAAAAPAPDWIHTLITDFGFPIALVMFFVWNSWKREERLANRITDLEKFQQEKLLEIAQQCAEAIVDNTAALNRLIKALEDRPCLCEGSEFVARMTILVEKIDSLTERVGQPPPPATTRPAPG